VGKGLCFFVVDEEAVLHIIHSLGRKVRQDKSFSILSAYCLKKMYNGSCVYIWMIILAKLLDIIKCG